MSRQIGSVLAILALPAFLLAHGGEDHGGASHDEPATPAPRHGGKVLASGSHFFEVIFEDGGLHVFPLSSAGGPLAPRDLRGKVTLRARRGKPQALALEPVRDSSGGVTHLMARGDFSKIRDGSRKAVFQLEGLGASGAEFWTVLRRTPGAKMAGSHSDHSAGSGSHHDMAGSHSAHAAGSESHHDMAGSHTAHSSEEVSSAAKLSLEKKRYPLDWCLVSGDALGGDGSTIDHVYKGRLVQLCCKGCIRAFDQDPEKYLAILDAAARGKSVRRPAGSHSSRGGSPSGQGHGGHDHGGHAH